MILEKYPLCRVNIFFNQPKELKWIFEVVGSELAAKLQVNVRKLVFNIPGEARAHSHTLF